MWRWLKRSVGWRKPKAVSFQEDVAVAAEGIYYRSWSTQIQKWPSVWSWESICEFGFSFHEAMYPDLHYGAYMEAEWFFTVEHDGRLQRLSFDVCYFSIEELPSLLFEKLPGFSRDALQPGWRQYQKGLRNVKGEGQWLAWQKAGFAWPDHA
jgi:hypothetical protein